MPLIRRGLLATLLAVSPIILIPRPVAAENVPEKVWEELLRLLGLRGGDSAPGQPSVDAPTGGTPGGVEDPLFIIDHHDPDLFTGGGASEGGGGGFETTLPGGSGPSGGSDFLFDLLDQGEHFLHPPNGGGGEIVAPLPRSEGPLPIPEPGTSLLVALGVAALALRRARARKRA
jgi:hypothetical protein